MSKVNKTLFAACIALGLVGSAPELRAAEPEWLTSYPDALAKAKEAGRCILISFRVSEGDAGAACDAFEKDIFASDAFKSWAARRVILVKATPEENADLVEKFAIQGYPVVVFLDDAGTETGRSGVLKGATPEQWVEDANGKTSTKAERERWLTSYDDAVARAKKEKKLILADFTGKEWCHWCKKLKAEVFDTEEFTDWADANVILLELDYPRDEKSDQPAELKAQNEKLQREYGIKGFPTILFLDAKGKKKGELGYKEGGPEEWLKDARKIAGNKKLPKKKAGHG